uniref:Uncharacterized protein n=1 Tax=Anguilla anguilla TaxID=7936 RepID=A0A0E9THV6_ANGAN
MAAQREIALCLHSLGLICVCTAESRD